MTPPSERAAFTTDNSCPCCGYDFGVRHVDMRTRCPSCKCAVRIEVFVEATYITADAPPVAPSERAAIDLEAIEKRLAEPIPSLSLTILDLRECIAEVRALRETMRYHTYEALQSELLAVRAAVAEESKRADELNDCWMEQARQCADYITERDAAIERADRAEAAARELREEYLGREKWRVAHRGQVWGCPEGCDCIFCRTAWLTGGNES